MADDFFGALVSGGDRFAADEITSGSVTRKHPRVKIQHGDDGTAVDASTANPLPVDIIGTFPALDVDEVPATNATSDRIATVQHVGRVKYAPSGANDYGVAPYEIVTVHVNEATAGDRTIRAAPGATKRIVVIGYDLVAAGAVSVLWKSGTTNQGGARSLAASGGIVKPPAWPWIVCGTNQALVLNLSAAVQVSGDVLLIEPLV